MKQHTFVILLILLMLPLCALPILIRDTGDTVGRIRIPEQDITAWATMPMHEPDCGCCPSLWNGGIIYTDADLSTVRLYDTMNLYVFDGSRHVMECVEITPCIRVGGWLIGWRGVVRAKGDIIVYSAGKAHRFTRL